MPLKLKLAAQEQIVVNGAVMTNGGCRTTLVIKNFAHILREKDVLHEQQANTPTKRLYLQVQAMLMQPPPSPRLLENFRGLFAALRVAYVEPVNQQTLDDVKAHVDVGDYYRALMKLQPLIAYEAGLLNVEQHQWRRSSARPRNGHEHEHEQR
jgi:flagellar protein FlbT